MMLFQKMYQTLLFLWVVFFCFLVFSAPSLFDPRFLSPRPLPSQVTIPQNTPIIPLCPLGLPIQLCLASTSFPLMQIQSNTPPSPMMFTPFSHKTQDISSKRRKKLLSKYRWRSYQYSNKKHKLESLSEKERSIEPEDDYYRLHIQEQPEADSLTQVIQESQVNEQQISHVGELRAVPTEEVLNAVEQQEDVSPQPDTPPSTPTIENPSSPPQTDPQNSTAEEEVKEETTEEVKEEPVQEEIHIMITRPTQAIALNYNHTPTQCSGEGSGNTEAVSICVDCSTRTNWNLEDESLEVLGAITNATPNAYFKAQLEKKIKGKICHRSSIQSIKNNFEKTCGNISFEDYVSEVLICESCRNKIPPAFMLSMISLESDGKCEAQGDQNRSRGLFQININFHKEPPLCTLAQKEQIQNAGLAILKDSPQCLENPVVNTQKSIDILKKQYRAVNGSQSDFNCQSPSMNTQQTNQWRKALASYNGGQSHIKRMQNMPKPKAISDEKWVAMDEWQKIRLQYFFYKSFGDRNGRIRTVSPQLRMGNLAHVETALGSTGHSNNQLSLFNSWEQALGNKIDLSQCP